MINQNFKNEVVNAFQTSLYFHNIMKDIDDKKYNSLRLNMDQAIDELQIQINQKIGPNEESIHNARIETLNEMYSCWYKVVEFIETTLEQITEIKK